MSIKMTYPVILARMQSQANPENKAGMRRYGINTEKTLGIPMPFLRQLAREIGKDHQIAEQLWASEIHESRILATLVDISAQVTSEQMDRWVRDFNSWDICDQCCSNLFSFTPVAFSKAMEWSASHPEFVKRAGFALAVKDKHSSDGQFETFLVNIKSGADDTRNFVKKAVNWALRQIGKRNLNLNRQAIAIAQEIREMNSSSARWIAADALRELTSVAVQTRIKSK
jgi:3-methyladenine DNA glycosylase AlkD